MYRFYPRQATLQASSSGRPSWTDREKGKDGEKKTEHEIQWEEDRKYEKGEETEHVRGGQRDSVVHREVDGEGDLSRERERSREKDGLEEQGSEELANQTPQQRQGMAQKPDARSSKMERTGILVRTLLKAILGITPMFNAHSDLLVFMS